MSSPALALSRSILFLGIAAVFPVQGTVLTFNACGGGLGTALEGDRCRYANINQDYGDRVTGPSMNGGRLQYGQLGEGWTPNVTVAYGPDGSAIHGWDNNYAGLWTVIWTEDRSGQLAITMTADPGYQVSFYGLRIGGYVFNPGPWPLVIGSLSLTSSDSGLLWSQTNVNVTQDGPIIFDFQNPYLSGSGGSLTFLMDVTNLPTGNANRESIGIDLVRFGQGAALSNELQLAQNGVAEVPEPGTLPFTLIAAGICLAARRLGCR